LLHNLKLDLFILITLVYSAELLTDFSYKLQRCIGQTPCSLEHYRVVTTFSWVLYFSAFVPSFVCHEAYIANNSKRRHRPYVDVGKTTKLGLFRVSSTKYRPTRSSTFGSTRWWI